VFPENASGKTQKSEKSGKKGKMILSAGDFNGDGKDDLLMRGPARSRDTASVLRPGSRL